MNTESKVIDQKLTPFVTKPTLGDTYTGFVKSVCEILGFESHLDIISDAQRVKIHLNRVGNDRINTLIDTLKSAVGSNHHWDKEVISALDELEGLYETSDMDSTFLWVVSEGLPLSVSFFGIDEDIVYLLIQRVKVVNENAIGGLPLFMPQATEEVSIFLDNDYALGVSYSDSFTRSDDLVEMFFIPCIDMLEVPVGKVRDMLNQVLKNRIIETQ